MQPRHTPQAIIAALGLEPLPHEGGYFRQTWRTAAGSAILYLITVDGFSALHRLASDELWHFHAGDPVEQLQLDPRNGSARVVTLGADVLAGRQPQVVVPGGVWQGARLAAAMPSVSRFEWSLLSCTMAPPWDERAFELGRRDALLREFPSHSALIHALTR